MSAGNILKNKKLNDMEIKNYIYISISFKCYSKHTIYIQTINSNNISFLFNSSHFLFKIQTKFKETNKCHQNSSLKTAAIDLYIYACYWYLLSNPINSSSSLLGIQPSSHN
jgi:hypothetical protein